MAVAEPVVYLTSQAAWLWLSFAVGAAFGSFFNVVAYRLPRGMSLNHPGSRCPACGRPIRWYDNVPILGWLMLGGRCRDCRAAISPRYPIVESLVAVATGIVCYSTIEPLDAAKVVLYAVDATLFGFRLLLVYSLVCAALLEFDRNRAPLRLLAVVLCVGIVVPILFPELRGSPAAGITDRALRCGQLLAAAGLLGLLAWPLLVERSDRSGIRDAGARVVELLAVAVFLGLLPTLAVAAFAAAFCLATRLLARLTRPAARFGWAAALTIGTLVWIAAGEQTAGRWLPHFDEQRGMTLAAAGAIVAVLSIAARLARPPHIEEAKTARKRD